MLNEMSEVLHLFTSNPAVNFLTLISDKISYKPMFGSLPQLTRPSRSGDTRSQARCESLNMEDQENRRSHSELQRDLSQDKTGQMSVSSLLEWQVTTAAGLRDKEEKLKMTMGLADRQKSKIEELRKSREALGTFYL